jgi:hypothetical protein
VLCRFFAEQACNGEHLYACNQYGSLLYLLGTGRMDDPTTKKRLDPSSPDALKVTEPRLAHIQRFFFLTGLFVSALQLRESGIQALTKACKGDEVDSCHFLANHYIRKSNQVDRNPTLASQYYDKCCTHNHAPSCHNLAVLYKKGDVGIPPNEEQFEKYKQRTESLIGSTGIGLKPGHKVA